MSEDREDEERSWLFWNCDRVNLVRRKRNINQRPRSSAVRCRALDFHRRVIPSVLYGLMRQEKAMRRRRGRGVTLGAGLKNHAACKLNATREGARSVFLLFRRRALNSASKRGKVEQLEKLSAHQHAG